MDPLTVAIATAVVAGVASGAGESAGQGLAALCSRVRNRFRANPEVLESPEAAAQALDYEFAQDPEFRDECHTLWARTQGGGPSNSFSGEAKNVVQARDIHGGMNLN